jgi:hypothetical protein
VPGRKNSSLVEQKNGSVVRRRIGERRLQERRAAATLARGRARPSRYSRISFNSPSGSRKIHTLQTNVPSCSSIVDRQLALSKIDIA